jgi:hypothetical protein
MPEQIKMTHGELAELIAKDVRRHAHCEGFRSISLYALRDGQIPGVNWSEGAINFGEADQASCVAALREVIPRMQLQYRLVER